MATTYYIATAANGGDDGHPGTLAEPWLTLAHAVSTISSGDTVYLRSGTWQDERLYVFYKGYTSTTTFKAYTGETPVIDMRNSGTTSTACGIRCEGTNYIKVDGITVRNSGYCSLYIANCDNLIVTNNTTEHSRLSGLFISGCDNFEVSYNDVKWSQCTSASHDHSTWASWSEECISIENCSQGEVHHNSISHGSAIAGGGGGEGLNIKSGGSYINIHDNTVDQARDDLVESTRYSMGVDAFAAETHHIYFYRNIIKNGSYGIILESESGGYAHHLYAWNNIIVHCGHSTSIHGGGLAFPNWGTQGLKQYCYFWNNTVYDCYYGFMVTTTNTAAPLLVQNNILASCESDVYYWGAGTDQGDFTLDHNLDSGTFDFDDAPNDFHIGIDSDAIDAGTTIADFDVDYDGVSRPQGSAWDIGAYEYFGEEALLAAGSGSFLWSGEAATLTLETGKKIKLRHIRKA